MVQDERRTLQAELPWGGAEDLVNTSARGPSLPTAAVALGVVGLTAVALFLLYRMRTPAQTTAVVAGQAGEAASAKAPEPPWKLFSQWPPDVKPDVALLLSGEQHGYIQPCGCTRPQKGGLERRYNFLQTLTRERGWPVVAVDLGDVAPKSAPQALLLYKYSMRALNQMGYTAVGFGKNEFDLEPLTVLAEYALNSKSPRVLAANLKDKDKNYPDMVADWKTAGGAGGVPRVGVVGVVADSVAHPAEKLKQAAFESADRVLRSVLQNREFLAEKPELRVLLYQGTEEEAKACATKFPEFHVILCLSPEEEPAGKPEKVGKTLVVVVGQKGRYVGLVGAFRRGPDFDLYYQLVPMSEAYETPPGKDAENPVLGILEEYSREVKRGNYLTQYPRAPHAMQAAFRGATYVGSEKCKRCHESAYKVWKDSPHSRAYQTLVDAKRPSLRQFDGECILCHVTGFSYEGGFRSAEKTPFLENNGCENCHGPGSVHAKLGGGSPPELLAAMNPFKTREKETPEQKRVRINRLDGSCRKCHDEDNDANWDIKKWEKIAHPTPPDEK